MQIILQCTATTKRGPSGHYREVTLSTIERQHILWYSIVANLRVNNMVALLNIVYNYTVWVEWVYITTPM